MSSTALIDCPTALSEPEVRLLQEFARDRRVIEAGALLGYSTIKLAQVAAHVTSIDRHEGYSGLTLKRFMQNIERSGFRHKILPLVGDCFDILPTLAGDFTFIDLTGTYEDTMRALWSAPSSLMAVHDYHRVGCEGVALAVHECSWLRPIGRADTLLVMEHQT